MKANYFLTGIADDPNICSEGDDDLPIRRLEGNSRSSSTLDLPSESGKQVDLFSEIHLNELKKLEKQLEQVKFPFLLAISWFRPHSH